MKYRFIFFAVIGVFLIVAVNAANLDAANEALESKEVFKKSVACVAGDAGCSAACFFEGGGCCGHVGECKSVCYCHNSGYDNRCHNCDYNGH